MEHCNKGRLLDVGAGAGNVTQQLAPLFEEVVTTEVSSMNAVRLRQRGFVCVETPVPTEEAVGSSPFNVVGYGPPNADYVE